MITAARSFTTYCPSCATGFPIDARKVPERGVAAICSECSRVFVVALPETWAPHQEPQHAEPVASEADGLGDVAVAIPAAKEPLPPPQPELPSLELPTFGFQLGAPQEATAVDLEPPESLLDVDPVSGSGLASVQEEEEAEALPPLRAELPTAEGSTAVEEVPTAEEVTAAEEVTPVEEVALDEGTAAEAPPAPRAELPTAAPPQSPPRQEPRYVDLSHFANDALAEEAPEITAWPPKSPAAGRERFGKRDPHSRAQHLARVLVSDIIAYYPVRYQEALSRGTLPTDFENEIKKSWREYVDQVGAEMAESTPYFNEALNEVLARGGKVF